MINQTIYWQNTYFSFKIQSRTVVITILLLVLLIIACIISLAIGEVAIDIMEIPALIMSNEGGINEFILKSVRIPRLITALFVGASLGIAGTIFQTITRNPLASPDIIGMNAGASLGAVVAVVFFGDLSLWITPLAIMGSLCITIIVFSLSWKNGIHPNRLILVGIGASFVLYAFIDFLITRTDIYRVSAIIQWLSGSLNSRNWEHVAISSFSYLFLILPIILLSRSLNQFDLGDDLASGLGIAVSKLRVVYGLIAVLLSGFSVAAAGPIAFVAFVSGPLARRITHSPGANLIISSLIGANIMIFADFLSRQLFAPVQLPVGIFTAVIGAPYLLWLLSCMISRGKI